MRCIPRAVAMTARGEVLREWLFRRKDSEGQPRLAYNKLKGEAKGWFKAQRRILSVNIINVLGYLNLSFAYFARLSTKKSERVDPSRRLDFLVLSSRKKKIKICGAAACVSIGSIS